MIYLIAANIFLFGLIIGSFLNCLVWRLHTCEKITGRSYCPKCRKQIAWYDNIPVLSFLFLRGKCRKCHQPISRQYPLIELITGILFILAFIRIYQLSVISYQLNSIDIVSNLFLILNSKFLIHLFLQFFIISVMIVIFIYDLRWYMILDKVTFPAIVIVSGLNLYLGMDWQNLLLSAIIGIGFFLFQFVVSKGKWIGGGDIRLGLLMGVALGWPNVIVAIMLAYFAGSIIGIGLILFKKKEMGSMVPLGAFLAPATVITLLYGDAIFKWYMGLFRF
jgi:prepilin signal peptidase PulO-like enzyme (type II secretory pathway)